MNYRVNKAEFKNFKGLSEGKVMFNGETKFLIGTNGAGKTTVIDAIMMAIRGTIKKSNGKDLLKKDRYYLIGDEAKESSVMLTLLETDTGKEVVINRIFDAKKNSIDIRYSNGDPIGESFLDSLLSEFSINPVSFLSKTPKEQAILLGIDTQTFDKETQKEKQELQSRNILKLSKMDTLRAMGDVPKAEQINLSDLYQKLAQAKQESLNLAEIDKLEESVNVINNSIKELESVEKADRIDTEELYISLSQAKNIENMNSSISARKIEIGSQILDAKQKIKELQELISSLNNELETLAPVGIEKSSDTILKEIETAKEINLKASAYEKATREIEEKTQRKFELSNRIEDLKGRISFLPPVEEIQAQIEMAEDNNKKFIEYQKYLSVKKEVEKATDSWREQSDKIKEIDKKKTEYLASLQLPLPELGIDENGGLTFDGREIDEVNFNHAKMVEIAVALLSHSSPNLKTIFVKDGNLYDPETLETLENLGFQIIFEYVESPMPTKNLIQIKEVVR